MHLTHAKSNPKSTERDRPEIEITPEMIEAGLAELFYYERGADDGAECIAEIYTAMERARLQGARKTLQHPRLPRRFSGQCP
jgi:hypothetical protein